MLKVILAGGGTGGHIYPAIAIANEFKYRFPDSEILFIGTRKGLEKELVPKK
jgi:UDP-N-acetylglucosamine--N-acetylmuramyl-(pentapeptide) pyrophosphoryl-undecaprenol N-acetylglucosamine transferase